MTLLLHAGPAQGCGGYLSMPMGMFGSPDPNLDGRYEPRMDCLWTIEMPVNKAINLTFSSFDLEGTSGATCRYDHVRVNHMGHLFEGEYMLNWASLLSIHRCSQGWESKEFSR